MKLQAYKSHIVSCLLSEICGLFLFQFFGREWLCQSFQEWLLSIFFALAFTDSRVLNGLHCIVFYIFSQIQKADPSNQMPGLSDLRF